MPAVPAALPPDEELRLSILRKHAVLDTPPERAYDRITELAQRLFDVPIALVSLVDEHRQWFKSCVGIDVRETARDIAFCAHALLQHEPFVIPDTQLDPRFADNPFVTSPPFVRFYAGAPLVSAGAALGTLCIIDMKPRHLDVRERDALVDLAAMVVEVLELRLVRHELEERGKALMLALREGEQDRRALAYQTGVLRSVVDSTAEGILVVDEKGALQILSKSAKDILQVEPSATFAELREGYETLLPDGETPCPPAEQPLSRAMRGEACDNVELFLRRPDGSGNHVSVSSRPLHDVDGRPRGGVVTIRDVTELRRAREELAMLATTDGLTGLANKRALDQRLAQLVAEADRGRSFAVILVDIDHFKRVNDTHGHLVGDQVLVAVAKALRSRLRRTDFLARYGGEEICVLLVDVDAARAVKVAEDLRTALRSMGGPIPVTASFGVCATETMSDRSAAAMVKAADDALYRAKGAGRDRVEAHAAVSGGGATGTGSPFRRRAR